jgi:hypothetical protein
VVAQEARIDLEFPGRIVADRLNGPVELVAQCFGEELLDRHVELGREDHRQTRVNVVLQALVSSPQFSRPWPP